MLDVVSRAEWMLELFDELPQVCDGVEVVLKRDELDYLPKMWHGNGSPDSADLREGTERSPGASRGLAANQPLFADVVIICDDVSDNDEDELDG